MQFYTGILKHIASLIESLCYKTRKDKKQSSLAVTYAILTADCKGASVLNEQSCEFSTATSPSQARACLHRNA